MGGRGGAGSVRYRSNRTHRKWGDLVVGSVQAARGPDGLTDGRLPAANDATDRADRGLNDGCTCKYARRRGPASSRRARRPHFGRPSRGGALGSSPAGRPGSHRRPTAAAWTRTPGRSPCPRRRWPRPLTRPSSAPSARLGRGRANSGGCGRVRLRIPGPGHRCGRQHGANRSHQRAGGQHGACRWCSPVHRFGRYRCVRC